MTITSNKALEWGELRWDIADVIPNMRKDLYTFSIQIGFRFPQNISFNIIYDDYIGDLDTNGDVYESLYNDISDMMRDMNDKICEKCCVYSDPNELSNWLNKELVVYGYKDRILKNVARVIEYNNYKYKRVDSANEWCYRLWNWAKRWLSKNE